MKIGRLNLNPFKRKDNKPIYTCSCCGQEYDEIPLCFGSNFPEYYYSIPIDEREKRIELTESLCVVDEEHFFHRCRLIIPIVDHAENLIWNVWVSISKENFIKRNDLWTNPDRINEPPYFGWLQTEIPTYGTTLNIKSMAFEQAVGLIPELEVIEENHNLQNDQKTGITLQKALSIINEIMKIEHGK